jgi:hypothetical protein
MKHEYSKQDVETCNLIEIVSCFSMEHGAFECYLLHRLPELPHMPAQLMPRATLMNPPLAKFLDQLQHNATSADGLQHNTTLATAT